MSNRVLVAHPHVVLSFVERGLTWSQVLSELIDNSFGEAAGNAQTVLIGIDRKGISIKDDGRGVDDINRLATLGDSGSYQQRTDDLGQFGVGGKAWLSKAAVLYVDTVYQDRRHRHFFNYGPIIEAIRKHEPATWLKAYEGKGTSARSKPSYTILNLLELHQAQVFQVPAMKKELERRFWPGLEHGRKITIVDLRNRPHRVYELETMVPPNWTDKIEFSGCVNGRKYRAQLGILTEEVGVYGGLFLGYAYRNICIEKNFVSRSIPTRIHGRIDLSGDWRDTLNNYKDGLTKDRDALLLDIERQAKQLIELADKYAEEIRIDKISSEISRNLSIRLVKAGNEGEKRPRKEPNPDAPERIKPDKSKTPKPTKKRKPPGQHGNTEQQEEVTNGIFLAWDHYQERDVDQVRIEPNGRKLTVTLNLDCPKFKPLTQQPRYPGIYIAMGNAVAFHCMKMKIEEIRQFFGPVVNDCENLEQMIRAIRVWFGFVAVDEEDSIEASEVA